MLALTRCPLHPRVTAVARKRPRSFCQSAGGRLHLNTHTSLTQGSQSGLPCRCPGIVWEPIGKRAHTQLVREIRSQSSQLAEQLWTDPGVKSEISVRELISTLKKKKKSQAGNELSNIAPKSSHARKKPPPADCPNRSASGPFSHDARKGGELRLTRSLS